MKNGVKICIMMLTMLFSSIFFGACSCFEPPKYTVSLEFIDGDPELDLKSESKEIEFGGGCEFSFLVPKGFDHSEIKATLNGSPIEYQVEFLEEYDDEAFIYTVDKQVTFSIEDVRKDSQLKVDLKTMPRLEFEIRIDSTFKDFTVATIEKDSMLLELTDENVLKEIDFQNNVAKVKYNDTVVLVQHKTYENTSLDAIYSTITKFTPEINKTRLGSLEFAQYNKALKGNGNYPYKSNYNTGIYYLGEVKENITLQSTIPGYVADKGFQIDRLPNTFYLFTNLSEFNSKMLTIETFSPTSASYSSNLSNMDRIVDNSTPIVLEAVEPFDIYRDRYDMHKVYLGANLSSDNLLTPKDKVNLNEELYIKVSSQFDADKLKCYLMNYEKDDMNTARVLQTKFISEKGYTYLKLTYEDLMQFSNKREMDTIGGTREYYSGSAILYVRPDLEYIADLGNEIVQLSMIKRLDKNDSLLASIEDFNFSAYILNKDGTKNYGFVDYHRMNMSNLEPRDMIYFYFDDVFKGVNMHGWPAYQKNIFLELRGPQYKDFRTVKIKSVVFRENNNELANFTCSVDDPKTFNGYKEFYFDLNENRHQYSYAMTVDIDIQDNSSAYYLDFSQMNFGSNSETIHVNNELKFSSINDFNTIHYLNKNDAKKLNLAHISYNSDLYYLARGNSGAFDIELRLNPLDSSTCVSSSSNLKDIRGNEISFVLSDGKTYYVKVLKLDRFYETLDNNIYVVRA